MTAAPITLDDALTDSALLGAALGPVAPWSAWRAILKAAFAEPLTPAELKTFKALAGGRKPPKRRVDELWVGAGRRSGKSRAAALVATYLAAILGDHAHRLAPGEQGVVLLVAPTKEQAGLARSYVQAFLSRSAYLAPMVANETADAIELTNGISIVIGAASYRTTRGPTLLAVVIDEAAFLRDETSAQPDVELVRAVMPSLLAAHGLLIGISSLYRKVGVLAARHRDHFGKNSDRVLVVQAPSVALNPTLDKAMIARAQRDDPTAARSEWEGQFREDIASLLSDESIDEAIDRARPLELPRVEGVRYAFFTDASAGRRDAFSLAGAHRSGDRCIVDLVLARKAPFDPRTVAREYAEVAKSYGCRSITGDAYAGEWTAAAFRSAGVEYRRSRKVKSELYLAAVAPFQGGRVSLPNVAPMIRQLRLLERRTGPSGKDRVDHRPNDFDDEANSVAGVIDCVLAPSQADLLRNRPVVGPTLIRRSPLIVDDEYGDAPGWREVDVGGVLGNVPWR